jgi:glycosyltransferase involved in cell wall biosynthesis
VGEFLKRCLKKMLEEKKIKVSCVMPVYNGEKYLRETIDSILNQTYSDFEFIIIDDGSTDNSVKIIESYKDSRIKLYKNEKNMGICDSTNKGIELAKGEYIALTDHDDISYNTRFEKQVKYLDENLDVGAVSALIHRENVKDKNNVNLGQIIEYCFENVNIFTIILWYTKAKNGFIYGVPNTVLMIRKEILIKYGIKYDSEYQYAQDMKMAFELLKLTKIRILQEILGYYRWHGNNSSITQLKQQIIVINKVIKEALNFLTDDIDLQNKLMEFLNNINRNACETNQEKNLIGNVIAKNKRDILKVNFLGISGFLRIKETERLGIIKTKYYLLNFLPILKVKKKGNTKSYYLMGLRLLKIKC